MTVEERRTYMSNDYDASAVARYVEILKQVDGLILCFPHWWFCHAGHAEGLGRSRVGSGHPPFIYDAKDGHLRPNLHNIKLFGVVTSYGSSWWIVRVFAGDAGRKVLMRGMKPLCAKDARSFYSRPLRHGRLDVRAHAMPSWRKSGGASRRSDRQAQSAAALAFLSPMEAHHVAQVHDFIGTFGDSPDRLRPRAADRQCPTPATMKWSHWSRAANGRAAARRPRRRLSPARSTQRRRPARGSPA